MKYYTFRKALNTLQHLSFVDHVLRHASTQAKHFGCGRISGKFQHHLKKEAKHPKILFTDKTKKDLRHDFTTNKEHYEQGFSHYIAIHAERKSKRLYNIYIETCCESCQLFWEISNITLDFFVKTS